MAETAFVPFDCPLHNVLITTEEGCSRCFVEMQASTEGMSPQDRADEVRIRVAEMPLTVRFSVLWAYVDRLVGRGTFNHELAEPESLMAEILGEGAIDPLTKLKSMMGDKPVIVVNPETGEVSNG